VLSFSVVGVVRCVVHVELTVDSVSLLRCKGKGLKASRNWPGVAQRVPGSLGSQISMTFGT
jgi:hypothetical protein